MALTPQYKVNQLAKDFGIKSKDMQEVLAQHGMEVKTQTALSPEEFGVLLDSLTKANQLDNIGDYLDGVTYIPSRMKEEKAPAEAKPESRPAAKTAPKAEAKPEEKAEPKAEVKAEVKPEPKAEKKPEVKAEPKTETKPEVKAEVKAEAKPEVKTEPKTEAKPEPKAEAKTEKAPEAAPARPAGQPRPLYTGNPYTRTPGAYTGDPYHSNRPAGTKVAAADGVSRTQGTPAARPQNNVPQGNRAPQGNAAPAGQSRPMGGNTAPARQQNNYGNNAPQGNRPAPQGGANNRFAAPQGGNRPAPQGGAPYGQQQNNRGAQRPQQGNNRGFGGGKDFDKDERVQNAPREKFQPQVIVRAQTPKGGVTQQKERGAVRVVDTRGTTVDLSKYDERLDNFVPDAVRDARGGNQKVKKAQGSLHGGPGKKGQQHGKKQVAPATKQALHITVPDEITVGELASRLKVTAGEVVKKLMLMGIMATVNQTIDFDTAFLIGDEMGAEVTKEVVVTIEEKLFDETEDNEDALSERAPVVCVMGHVDHGKTSLLDYIRNSHVTAGEAGGITQHIGAYRVKVKGKEITFLDTPGHEAFTAMRARGAQATDIAILVVAADDGIMPQTIEAINHAKAAGIDIIVAINKMDKPTANPDNIKQELTKYELVPEEWGGDVICCPVSALTGMGMDDLLENVLLVAEVKELKANPNRRAKGIIIEAKLDRGRGPVATVLVQNGTLHTGDIVIAGTAVGRVRAMTDHTGRTLKVAGPSVPVEITGLAEVPEAGDEFNAVEDEKMARELADQRRNTAKEAEFKANARASLNDLFAQISEGVKTLNIIVKADVGGSAEAVKASLEKISNEEVRVSVIHSAAGAINEGDVMFAAASNAIIVGFNVRPDKAASDSAERQGVEIRTYRVIYDCIEEVTAAMKGMLAPKFREVINGHAEVRQLIHVPNVGMIAGSYITDGKVTRASQIRVLRDGIVIFEDKISSLKRFKDDAKEVAQGYECGIGLERFNDMKVGDVLESFSMEQIEQ
ncbi:MAG: translation initiation factor IF-2 [Clostridia bacterium]|nr:translation initiation factor IF-2 [Clostridia bacterium]